MSKVSPNLDEINAMRKAAPPGPVVVLNLMKFRADGGQEAYAEYMKVVGTIVDGLGVEPLYAGMAGKDFAAGEEWDMVLLARYPNFEAFANLMTHPTYVNEAIPHRETALEKAMLMMTQPMDLL